MTVTYLIQYLKYKDGDLEQNFWIMLCLKWVFLNYALNGGHSKKKLIVAIWK